MRALLLLLVLTPASATTLLDWGLRELSAHSEAILVARVSAQSTRETADQRILTDTWLEVEQVLAGRASETLRITQLGGRIGERVQQVHAQATFAPEERVLVFLERADTGQLVVAGMQLGKYTLHGGMARRVPLHPRELNLDDALPIDTLLARIRRLNPPRLLRPAPVSVPAPATPGPVEVLR